MRTIMMTIMVFWLVVWNMNFIFPLIGNFIIPTDELIFFRGVGIPPTRFIFVYKWHYGCYFDGRDSKNWLVTGLGHLFYGGRNPHGWKVFFKNIF